MNPGASTTDGLMMEAVQPKPIDLALEPPFSLGSLEARPATLEVIHARGREQLEPRIMQVLTALARRRGEVVSRDELTATCWNGRIVGDDSINRCIFRLRKLAEAVGGFAIETVPRVGFRLTELGAGRPRRSRRLWPAGAVLAVAVVAALALGLALRPRAASERLRVNVESPRAAVVDPTTRSLEPALFDELQAQVAASGVEMTGSGARADYRLTSTVAPEGRQVRVGVRLVERRTGAPVWSAQFSGAPAEVRRRAAVAAAGATQCLARVMAPGAGPIAEQPRQDYVLACVMVEDPQAAPNALALLERVVERAPRFSPGHSGIAVMSAIAAKDIDEPLKSRIKARGAAEATVALRLNPRDGMAYLAQEMLVTPRTDWVERQRLLAQGLAVDPQNFALAARQALVLSAVGRLSESEAFHHQAVTLNPFSANAYAELALTLDSRNAIDAARAVIAEASARWPDNPQVQSVGMQIEAVHGDPGKALALLRDPQFGGQIATPEERAILERAMLARMSGAPGKMAEARQAVRAALADGLWPPLAVEVMSALGDVDGALAAAEAAARTHSEFEPTYLFHGSTAPLRADARFMRVARAWGLIDYWRRSGRWPDFCRAPQRTYDCAAVAARPGD
jgi:tetratricopeptide (TPR) repeat protein